MTAVVAPSLLTVFLVLTATAGPRLVRAAAPMLTRAPRIAVFALIGSLLLWSLAVGSLSLMSAWLVTGPHVLPGPLGDVCQRCLAASSPFASFTPVETVVPVVFLLAMPALGAVILLGVAVPGWLRRRRSTRELCRDIARESRRARVKGHEVRLIPDSRPLAFSLPRRHGGIVVSDGLCDTLDSEELTAVLTHERAHLRQRHHLILMLLAILTGPIRWIPLASAIAEAVPRYLEIAADNAARRRTGTTALARALLKLAQPDTEIVTSPSARDGALLHAAGPDRIGQLVAPSRVRSALLPAAALTIQLAACAIAVAAVHAPYAYVAVTGCQLPM